MPTEEEQVAEAVRAALEEYKKQVRAEALRAQKEEGWCENGMNGAFERLGIPPVQTFDVMVAVQPPEVWHTITVRGVDSLEEAQQKAIDPEFFLEQTGIDPVGGLRGNGIRLPREGELVPGMTDPEMELVRSQRCGIWDPSRDYACTRTRGHIANPDLDSRGVDSRPANGRIFLVWDHTEEDREQEQLNIKRHEEKRPGFAEYA